MSRHSEEAGWKPRDRHFPKYTRKDMKVTGADPTRTCFAATLTDWRQYYSHSFRTGLRYLIVFTDKSPVHPKRQRLQAVDCSVRMRTSSPGGGMADAVDSKSTESNLMRVQLPPRAPTQRRSAETSRLRKPQALSTSLHEGATGTPTSPISPARQTVSPSHPGAAISPVRPGHAGAGPFYPWTVPLAPGLIHPGALLTY